MPMMMIDGPEKAGKTTVIRKITQIWESTVGTGRVHMQHWGPVSPDDRVYSTDLRAAVELAVRPTELVIWDRGWAAEHVYGKLLNRQERRLAEDPWLGEWLHSRAVQSVGSCFIITAPEELLSNRRTADDLKVPIADEKRMFEEYAVRFGWRQFCTVKTDRHVIMGNRVILATESDDILEQTARTMLTAVGRDMSGPLYNPPPAYCGPRGAKVIFVGEALSDNPGVPGAWLPFSSRYTTMLGRMLEDDAFKCGWTNARDCAPQQLRSASVIVSCGEAAAHWVGGYVNPQQHVNIPHPSYLFRYNNGKNDELKEEVARIIATIRQNYL